MYNAKLINKQKLSGRSTEPFATSVYLWFPMYTLKDIENNCIKRWSEVTPFWRWGSNFFDVIKPMISW